MPTIFAVTPNPALDLTVTVPALVPGATHRVPHVLRRLGGKGLNVAAVATEQGYSAAALGPVAHRALEEFAEQCASGSGVPLPPTLRQLFTDTPTALRCTVAVHQTDAPDTTSIVNERGAAHPPEVFDSLLATLGGELRSGDVVTFSGSLPPETPEDFIINLGQLCENTGTPWIADTAGEALRLACDHHATFVTPNAEELAATTGTDSVTDGVATLLAWGARNVVITLGSEGILAASADADRPRLRARLAAPLSGNPTGAGDALTAALAVGLLSTPRLDQERFTKLICTAVAWSAAAVRQPVAGSIGHHWHELYPDIHLTEGD